MDLAQVIFVKAEENNIEIEIPLKSLTRRSSQFKKKSSWVV